MTINIDFKMKYYKTGSYGKLIKEVEAVKETDKCVYIKNEFNEKEERVVKLGQYANYFKTYDEAKCFLETKKQIKIKQLEASLKRAKLELQEIYNL
jgi:prefoldin subunit 5